MGCWGGFKGITNIDTVCSGQTCVFQSAKLNIICKISNRSNRCHREIGSEQEGSQRPIIMMRCCQRSLCKSIYIVKHTCWDNLGLFTGYIRSVNSGEAVPCLASARYLFPSVLSVTQELWLNWIDSFIYHDHHHPVSWTLGQRVLNIGQQHIPCLLTIDLAWLGFTYIKWFQSASLSELGMGSILWSAL